MKAFSGLHQTVEEIGIDDNFALHSTKVEALTEDQNSRDLSIKLAEHMSEP